MLLVHPNININSFVRYHMYQSLYERVPGGYQVRYEYTSCVLYIAHLASSFPDRRERTVAELLAQLIGNLESRPLLPSRHDVIPAGEVRAPLRGHVRAVHLRWGIPADAYVVERRLVLRLEAPIPQAMQSVGTG